MISAKEAKTLAGIDPRTTKEKFFDDVSHWIEEMAKTGRRQMLYKVPSKYDNHNLLIDLEIHLEDLGFDVCYNHSNNMLDVRW